MKTFTGTSFQKSAIMLPVSEIEPIAQPYRVKHTTDGAKGLQPHVTLVYPFVPCAEFNDSVMTRLTQVVGALKPFSFQLAKLSRFVDHKALFLDPQPNTAILDLIRAIVAVFPQHQPYEGTVSLDQLHPHVTIALGKSNAELDEVEARFMKEASAILPVTVQVNEVWLLVDADGEWQRHSTVALAG